MLNRLAAQRVGCLGTEQAAGKDRAAVMMGGHDTDAIWYLDPKTARSYVTLADRPVTEPAIVKTVNARLAALIDRPTMPVLPPQCASRSVAVKTESGGASRPEDRRA